MTRRFVTVTYRDADGERKTERLEIIEDDSLDLATAHGYQGA